MKVIFMPIVWVITYWIFAMMISLPLAFAFWDINIFWDAVIFWQKPIGAGSFIRALSFVFCTLGTVASLIAE